MQTVSETNNNFRFTISMFNLGRVVGEQGLPPEFAHLLQGSRRRRRRQSAEMGDVSGSWRAVAVRFPRRADLEGRRRRRDA
jgi:hypothetical protein